MENWPNPFENLEPYFLFSFFFLHFLCFSFVYVAVLIWYANVCANNELFLFSADCWDKLKLEFWARSKLAGKCLLALCSACRAINAANWQWNCGTVKGQGSLLSTPLVSCRIPLLYECVCVCVSSARNGSVGFIAAEVDSCIGRSVGRAMQSSLLLIAGQLRLLNCEWSGSARHSG